MAETTTETQYGGVEGLTQLITDQLGVPVLLAQFMLLTMGVSLLALLWRLYTIYIEFKDPVKFEERQAVRRAKGAKKDE